VASDLTVLVTDDGDARRKRAWALVSLTWQISERGKRLILAVAVQYWFSTRKDTRRYEQEKLVDMARHSFGSCRPGK